MKCKDCSHYLNWVCYAPIPDVFLDYVSFIPGYGTHHFPVNPKRPAFECAAFVAEDTGNRDEHKTCK